MVAMINTESNVAGEMGPEPLLEPPDWDTQSMESRYTEESKVGFDPQHAACNGTLESRRSQGYASMGSSSTYMIDATGTDPVLLHGSDFPDQCYRNGSTAPLLYGYPPTDGDRSVFICILTSKLKGDWWMLNAMIQEIILGDV